MALLALYRGDAARFAARLIALSALALMLAGTARAEVRGSVSGAVVNGFARMTFSFEQQIAQTSSLANGVVVIEFETPIEIDLADLPGEIPDYVVAARLDPDHKVLRLALGQRLTVNSIAARDRLFVDLLPESWVGPPPGLPEDVVAELLRLAEEDAARALRSSEVKKDDKPPLALRIGRYPTFTRLVFDWSAPTQARLSRIADTVTVEFDRSAEIDLARLTTDAPPQLVLAQSAHSEDSLTITLEVTPGTDVRGFKEADSYVLDLAADAPGDQIAAELQDPSAPAAGPEIGAGSGVMQLEGTDGAIEATAPMQAVEDDVVSITVTPLDLAREAEIPAEVGESDADGTAPAAAMPGDGQLALADDPDASDAMAIDSLEEPYDPEAPVTIAVKEIGSDLQLTFPFREEVPAAAFQRGRTLWVAFDTKLPLDVTAIRRAAGGQIGAVDVFEVPGGQLLRLALTREFLASAASKGTRWLVTIGDLVLAPTAPLVLTRALRADGLAKVSVALADSGSVHWIDDETVGDRIAVVTALGPPRGQIKRQEFVEFAALPTAHGVAIMPYADDLAVRLATDEVVITRDRGLALSASLWPQFVPGEEAAANVVRPGFIDFARWRGDPDVLLRRKTQLIMSEIADQPVDQRANNRLLLARLLLAHELGVEALAMVKIAALEDPDVTNDSAFRAMRGIAALMAGRSEDADVDLLSHDLDDDPHVSLWRAVSAAAKEEWRSALTHFLAGAEALDAYEPDQQARFRLVAARAGLETNDLETAARNVAALERVDLDTATVAKRDLLSARLTEAYGRDDDAMTAYAQLATSPVRPVAAEAEERRILLFLNSGRMTPEGAIAALEAVAVTWRGDSIELFALRKLGELYADAGRYRDALKTMKIAVVNHSTGPYTRLIADDMTELFNRIYLEGEADKMEPIAALGLYYDFRELTPVGRRGDELIRKLAQRLVNVDLLDQAAELLAHQVDNRLTGSGRAQVAADLSLIYLMAHKPEPALRTIRQTRQAVLPQTLQTRRNLLEARALADLGRVELAIEILDGMEGEDVERLKGDALWRGKRWRQAGEQIEKMLGARWQEPEPLSEIERHDVLRSAIGYALGNDDLGLERLRRKFTSKMAASPDASSFEAVTKTADRNGMEIATLAREIASIDSLRNFLTDFKARGNELESSTTEGGQGSDAGI